MPKTNYPWLQDLQEKEKKRRPKVKEIRVMGGGPLSAQFGVEQFTGFGQDGQLQPQNPVGMVDTTQGQKPIHEGEGMRPEPNGSTTVVPANQMPQSQLKAMEQEQNVQGFQFGGNFTPRIGENILGKKTMQPNVSPRTPQVKQSQWTGIPYEKKGLPPITPVNPLTNPTEGLPPITPVNPLTNPTQGLPPITPVNPLEGTQIGTDPIQSTPLQNLDTNLGLPDIKADQIVDQGTQISPEQTKFNQAQQKLLKLSEGEDELSKRIREQARTKFKGEEQAAKGSLEQQMSQLGLGGREALSERAMAARGIGAQEAAVEGDLLKQQQQQAFQAAMKLPDVAMAGMKFEHQQDMEAFAAQLAAGDFAGAAKSFSNIFGKSIDFSQAITEQGIENFMNGMGIMSQALASGMSADEAQAMLQNSGAWQGMNMTEGDFNTLYNNMELQQDPLYQATQMAKGWVDQGLMTQEQADNFVDFITNTVANPEGVVFENGFMVTDEFGNEIGFFTSTDEANAFVAENPGSNIEFVKNHVGLSGQTGTGTGTGDPDATPNEIFEGWWEKSVPKEYKDEVTFDKWEAAGSPKTWKEYQDFTNTNPDVIPTIKNLTDTLPENVPESDRGVIKLYSQEDQDAIIEQIEAGNQAFVDFYSVPEDSVMHQLISESGDIEHLSAIPKEELFALSGRYITHSNGRKGIIWGLNHSSIDGFQRITIKDVETGEMTTYTRKYKK